MPVKEAGMLGDLRLGSSWTRPSGVSLRRGHVAGRFRRGDAMRAEIVLLAADGATNLAIAEQLGVTRVTVATWRSGSPPNGWTALPTSPALGLRARSGMRRSLKW